MDIKKIKKKIPKKRPKLKKPSLPRPKITFDRLGQLIFTFKEVTKIAIKTDKRLLIWIFVLNALWGFSAAPGFYLEKLIIDKLIESVGNPDWRAALYVIGLLVFARIVLEFSRNVVGRVTRYMARTLSRLLEAQLSVLIGKKLAELDLATIEDPEFKNKFDKIVRESGRRAWSFMMPLSDIPNYLVGFISAIALLVFLHPLVTVGVLIISLPQFVIDSKYIKKEYELRTSLSPLYRMWGWLNNYLLRNRNYLELKILNLSDYLSKRLISVQKETLEQRIALNKKRELSRLVSIVPLSIFELGLSMWIVFLVITEKITVGSFEMFIRALRSAQQNLTGLVSSFLEIYENYIYVSDLVWLLNLKPRIEGTKGGVKLENKTGYKIEFKDVWFKYRDDQNWIVKDTSFKINPGERVALVGENGVGKSTLIKLLARFYDPQKGEIIVGEHNLRDVNLPGWRSKLGVLFQMFETYPFSARESIGYGNVDRMNNLSEIKEAAKKSEIAGYIENLPLGWDNPLAPEFNKGVNPSIGQWQRIGIARMLFRKDADILILDEPTSNVDPKAEEKIFNELLKRTEGKILIFVSQRFSTVRRADRILVMDKGRIVEDGSHESLMEKGGLYEELFTLQAKAYQ